MVVGAVQACCMRVMVIGYVFYIHAESSKLVGLIIIQCRSLSILVTF